MRHLGLAAVMLLACKGNDKGGSAGGDKHAGACEISATTPAELVTGKTPQPIAPFTALKLGMSAADAAKACPSLFQGADARKQGNFYVGQIVGRFGHDGAYGRLNFTDDKLVSIDLTLPPEIADALTAAWGTPKTSTGKAPALAWLDDASGIRAMLGPPESVARELTISTYVPLAAFVEPDPKRIAFKPDAVLGKPAGELLKLFPQYVHPAHTSKETKELADKMMADMKKDVEKLGVDTSQRGPELEVGLPATPLGSDPTTHVILYNDDDGTVRSYGIWFRTKKTGDAGWPAEITDVVKAMDATWGPHKMVNETLGERHTWFDPKTGVRASTHVDPSRPDELDLVFVRYLPLASLFGAPGAAWGFEKAPLIGSTAEQLAAAYGNAVKISGDADDKTATLSLPPTDYDGDTARTTILMFLRDGGKVDEWHVSLPFRDYEPSRAEYEAALGTKLGKPAPARREHLIYGKHPAVDARYSDITHELDLEVTK